MQELKCTCGTCGSYSSEFISQGADILSVFGDFIVFHKENCGKLPGFKDTFTEFKKMSGGTIKLKGFIVE